MKKESELALPSQCRGERLLYGIDGTRFVSKDRGRDPQKSPVFAPIEGFQLYERHRAHHSFDLARRWFL